MARLKPRQRKILLALQECGGTARTREIAARAGLHINGVAQSLGALSQYVVCLGGKGGDCRWQLRMPIEKLHNHSV